MVAFMDKPLTGAECAVFQVQGARPEVLPWYAGAEIARFATQKLGLGPTSPLGLLFRVLQSVGELGDWIWRTLRWVYS